MCKGFVRIPRRLFEDKQWNAKRVYSELDAVTDIYTSACIQDRIEADGTVIRRNQLAMSVRSLAERWMWTKSKVERFLAALVKKGYIKIEASRSMTIVTIIDFGVEEDDAPKMQSETLTETPTETLARHQNPDKFRGLRVVSGTPTETPIETPTETASRAYMNDLSISMSIEKKEENNPLNPPKGYEDYDFSDMDKALLEVVFDWLNYKKERREKKYSPRGLKMFYGHLCKLSNNDPAIAKQIVEQSYVNNWAGIFELKQNNYGTASQSTQYNTQTSPSDSELQLQTLRLIEHLGEERRACRAAVR